MKKPINLNTDLDMKEDKIEKFRNAQKESEKVVKKKITFPELFKTKQKNGKTS